MVSLGDRLREALLHAGVAAPLEAPGIEVEAGHPIRGRFRARLRPLLRLGRDGVVWHSAGSLIDRHGAARVLDEVHRHHSGQSLHLLLHPLPPFGVVSPWGLERATYIPGESQTRCSGLVLGEGEHESEAALRYLANLAQQCQLMRGAELRTFWRETLGGGPFRQWLLAELQACVPGGEDTPAWTQGWTGLWNSFAGLSQPRLERMEEQIRSADPAHQEDLWRIGLAWILNQPSQRKPHPHKGQVKPERAGRRECFRRPWTLEDFPALAFHPELRPLVERLLPVRPLSFHGMRAAWLNARRIDLPWVDHLVSTALKEIVKSALQQHALHGVDTEDLFQEGLLGATEAALRYEAYDEDGVFRNFRAYASFWIWQRMQRHCHDLGHLIRHPVWHYEGNQVRKKGAFWVREPEGISPAQRLTPIVPLEAALEEPMGEGVITVGEVLACGGTPDATFSDPYVNTVQDLIRTNLFQSDLDPIEVMEQFRVAERVQEVIQTLSEREEKVLRMRFGVGTDAEEHTLEAIGQCFSVTRERIRQIEEKAIRKVRNPRYSKTLRAFLDPDPVEYSHSITRPLPLESTRILPPAPQSGYRYGWAGAQSSQPQPAPAPELQYNERSVAQAIQTMSTRLGSIEIVAKRIGAPVAWVQGWTEGFLPHRSLFSRLKELWQEVIQSETLTEDRTG